MSELEARFKKAVWLIRNGPKADSSNDTKLLYYGFYKQATEGDVKVNSPPLPPNIQIVHYLPASN